MPKQSASETKTPVRVNFKDVDKGAAAAAQAAIATGRQDPLKPPADARMSTDPKTGIQYTRWVERVVITQAFRTASGKGLMDVTVVSKIRQGTSNNGKRVWSHFYINNADEVSDGHQQMNDRSMGSIMSLLSATGYLPAGGVMKGTLLDKMFPMKGQPASASPLVNKTAMVNIAQQYRPKRNFKTNKPILDEEGEPIMEKRDQGESFLPDIPEAPQSKGTLTPKNGKSSKKGERLPKGVSRTLPSPVDDDDSADESQGD